MTARFEGLYLFGCVLFPFPEGTGAISTEQKFQVIYVQANLVWNLCTFPLSETSKFVGLFTKKGPIQHSQSRKDLICYKTDTHYTLSEFVDWSWGSLSPYRQAGICWKWSSEFVNYIKDCTVWHMYIQAETTKSIFVNGIFIYDCQKVLY